MSGLERAIKEVNDEITILIEKEKNVKNPENVVYYSNGIQSAIEKINYLKGNPPIGEGIEDKNYKVIGCRLEEKGCRATYYILEDVIKRFHPDNRIKFSYDNITFYNIKSNKWQDIDLRIVNQDSRGVWHLDDIKIVLKLDSNTVNIMYYDGNGSVKKASVKKVKNNDDLYKFLKGIRRSYKDNTILLNDLNSLKQIMELMIPKDPEEKRKNIKLVCKDCGSELDKEAKSRCPCCGTKL